MTRAPDWTEEEFRLLLSQPMASSEELKASLSRRSVEAIQLVRQGIEQFQRDGHSPLLSQMMQRVLEEPRES